MKKYIIFSFCTLFAICAAYTISYQKLSEGMKIRENQSGEIAGIFQGRYGKTGGQIDYGNL